MLAGDTFLIRRETKFTLSLSAALGLGFRTTRPESGLWKELLGARAKDAPSKWIPCMPFDRLRTSLSKDFEPIPVSRSP
jgi:hypothetical protein